MAAPDILPPQRRENAEPHERTSAIPSWVLLLAGLMLSIGAAYIAGERLDLPGRYGDGRTVEELQPARQEPQQGKANGAALYASMCAACHQANGQGLPGVFPPLAGSEWVSGDAHRLAAIVLRGVSGPITVKGVAYSGSMPTFKQQLDDGQLAALLTHVRGEWGNAGAQVDAATVAAARSKLPAQEGPFAGGAALQAWEK